MKLPFISLQNNQIRLKKLVPADFDRLYVVASDPEIWEQHPMKERYKREVFEEFFNSAIAEETSYLVINTQTKEVMGSSRYYEFDAQNKIVFVGYTFLARKWWGGAYNFMLKDLMLQHAFETVDEVRFHIGATNTRSLLAMKKIGGVLVGEENKAFGNTRNIPHLIFSIHKANWPPANNATTFPL